MNFNKEPETGNQLENRNKTLEKLRLVLEENKDKRISVVGTACTGKTTLLKNISQGIEISDLAPELTEEEKSFYYNAPLTPENRKKRLELRAKRAYVEAGQPAFGTSIAVGTELVVYLLINDELLKERINLRKDISFDDAKTIQNFLEKEIEESNLPVIKILVE